MSTSDTLMNTVAKADIVWMMLSTLLVILMTLPGLALFYGGLVRSKNMLSVLVQTLLVFSLIVMLWVLYGYSLSFGAAGPILGDLSKVGLIGVHIQSVVATFSPDVYIPEFAFIFFQATFAGITCVIILGAVVERIQFSAMLAFCALWFTFAYIPIAHMVWGEGGFLLNRGAIDFAGGTVVHINAGIAGLVAAYVLGPRIGYGREPMAPHNLPFSMIGACLLWVGWFGFNAGSNLEANAGATLPFINTLLAPAAGVLTWSLLEAKLRGKASMLGSASGALAGLVGITPACGTVGPLGAIAVGGITSACCLWGVMYLKSKLKADDSLDAFGIHGVGGIVGALLTGVFSAPYLGGQMGDSYNMGSQLWVQGEGVIITIAWSAIVAFLILKLLKKTMKLRVSEEAEREGLDIRSHGEAAYVR